MKVRIDGPNDRSLVIETAMDTVAVDVIDGQGKTHEVRLSAEGARVAAAALVEAAKKITR